MRFPPRSCTYSTARPATEWRIANRSGVTGHKAFFGPNPPNGASITYFLKSKPADKEKVKITVTNKEGKVIRDIDGTGDAGINRVTWDLRTRSVNEAPREPEASTAGATAGGGVTEAATEQASEQGGGFGGFQGTMRVEPGEYTVKVASGKLEQSTKVVVEEDPRIEISRRGSRRAPPGAQSTRADGNSGAAARRSITGLRTALKDYKTAKLPENIKKAADDLLKKVDTTCLKLGTPTQCGQPSPGLGWAGPPVVYTPAARHATHHATPRRNRELRRRADRMAARSDQGAARPAQGRDVRGADDHEDRSRSAQQDDARRERAVRRGSGWGRRGRKATSIRFTLRWEISGRRGFAAPQKGGDFFVFGSPNRIHVDMRDVFQEPSLLVHEPSGSWRAI